MARRFCATISVAVLVVLAFPITVNAASPAGAVPFGVPDGFAAAKMRAESRRLQHEAADDTSPVGPLAPHLRSEPLVAPPPPRIDVRDGYAGVEFEETGRIVPPDSHGAVGPGHFVHVVNSTVAVFGKASGAKLFQQPLATFFGRVSPATTMVFDPLASYDALAGRFIVIALGVDFDTETSHLLYAVSNTSNPLDGFTEMHKIDVKEFSTVVAGNVWGDHPRLGWNADAHVITINMFGFGDRRFSHVKIVTVDKAMALDVSPATFVTYGVNRDSTHFTLAAATMHGAAPGDPMWFVEEAGFGNGSAIRVVEMTGVLSVSPAFTDTVLPVAAYTLPPNAAQPYGHVRGVLDTNDARVLNAGWRAGALVAAHTVGLESDGSAHVRWYAIGTSAPVPMLTQQGTLSPGPGVHTYYPSIAIAAGGDLGLTFLQSSRSEFVSMYVTGRAVGDPSGMLRTAALAKAGERVYTAFEGSPYRAGDYSGISVDPDTGTSFCATNQYATAAPGNNWGTWIACFSLGPVHDLAIVAINAAPVLYGSAALTWPVSVVIQNRAPGAELIDIAHLGDGVSTGLVRLRVDVVDDDSEGCRPALVSLDARRNAQVFPRGRRTLGPQELMSVYYRVTYQCVSPRTSEPADASGADYRHVATVHHEHVDGNADTHPADDVCPRDVAVTVRDRCAGAAVTTDVRSR